MTVENNTPSHDDYIPTTVKGVHSETLNREFAKNDPCISQERADFILSLTDWQYREQVARILWKAVQLNNASEVIDELECNLDTSYSNHRKARSGTVMKAANDADYGDSDEQAA